MTETTTARARRAAGLPAANGEPGTELSPIDRRIARTRSMESRLVDAMAKGLDVNTLVGDAITAMRQTPRLVECSEPTFFGALMTAAQLGLRPNVGSLGHGWILPYWSTKNSGYEAQWVLGYQGMVELGYKSGLVAKIATDTIYSNETYRIRRGTHDELVHEPILDPDERGDMIAHYAVVWLTTGQQLWRAMADQDVRKIMERMAARDRNRNIVGPWANDYLPMAQKTPLRALWRFMPKTPTLALALSTDETVRQGMEPDAAMTTPGESQDVTTVTRADQQPETEEQRTERQLREQADQADVERG